MSWEDSLNVFHHIYSKEYGKKMKVRKEVQEYPNKPLEEAFMDKLNDAHEAIEGCFIDKLKDDNDDKTFSVGI